MDYEDVLSELEMMRTIVDMLDDHVQASINRTRNAFLIMIAIQIFLVNILTMVLASAR